MKELKALGGTLSCYRSSEHLRFNTLALLLHLAMLHWCFFLQNEVLCCVDNWKTVFSSISGKVQACVVKEMEASNTGLDESLRSVTYWKTRVQRHNLKYFLITLFAKTSLL